MREQSKTTFEKVGVARKSVSVAQRPQATGIFVAKASETFEKQRSNQKKTRQHADPSVRTKNHSGFTGVSINLI